MYSNYVFKNSCKIKFWTEKKIFVIVCLELRYSFLKNLKFALGVERVTRNSLTILLYFKNKKQQKL